MDKIFKVILCLLLLSQSIWAQREKHSLKTRGYLVFVKMNDFEQTIFLPHKNACKNYTFKKLAKIKGWLIRGQDNYEMYKAKLESKEYNVLLPRADANIDSFYTSPIKLGILPVELTYWETTPGKLKEDGGIPFDYKGKRYVINYIDDWDIAIEKIKVIK